MAGMDDRSLLSFAGMLSRDPAPGFVIANTTPMAWNG